MYEVTPRTTPTRLREKVGYDRAAAEAVLDEALVCHVGFLAEGASGGVRVLPTIHARMGEHLYLHGSTGTPLMRQAARGDLDVCVTVTLLDGVVLARSQFESSMNYRCVVVHGRARLVTDPAEKLPALRAVVEQVCRGRDEGSRPGNPRELAATAVLAVPLDEVSLKVSTGDPEDDPADLDGPWWAGVVPVHLAFGAPVPSADLAPGIALPDHVRDYARPIRDSTRDGA